MAAEAELTALAAEAEKAERLPDALLLCPPPPSGVDLITPDPRCGPYVCFFSRNGYSSLLTPRAAPACDVNRTVHTRCLVKR